jgi:hypothetical protein
MHNISFALTTDQVRQRIKTETRRNGWAWLADTFANNLPLRSGLPRDDGVILRGIVKGQGLKKGEHPERITCIKATAARREPLNWIDAEAVTREGFPGKDPAWFIRMYCDANGGEPAQEITVIQFTYPWLVSGRAELPLRQSIIWADSEQAAHLAATSSLPRGVSYALRGFTDDVPLCNGAPATGTASKNCPSCSTPFTWPRNEKQQAVRCPKCNAPLYPASSPALDVQSSMLDVRCSQLYP